MALALFFNQLSMSTQHLWDRCSFMSLFERVGLNLAGDLVRGVVAGFRPSAKATPPMMPRPARPTPIMADGVLPSHFAEALAMRGRLRRLLGGSPASAEWLRPGAASRGRLLGAGRELEAQVLGLAALADTVPLPSTLLAL